MARRRTARISRACVSRGTSRSADRGAPWVVVILVIAAAVGGYPAATAYLAARRTPEVEIARAVRVVTPTGGQARLPVLVASGYVIARRSAEVGGKVGGRLAYMGVEEGTRVRANQIIARLERGDLDAQHAAADAAVAEAEAQLAEAIASRDESRRELDRQLALRKDGIATAAAVTAAQAAAAVADARVQSAQAALASARARVRVVEEAIENTNVRAPFDGVVISKRAEVGETVSPFGVAGQATREGGAIAKIADLKELEVETEVSESNVAKLRPGMPADMRLQAYPDVPYSAHVRQIFPAADRAKAIVEVRVTIEAPDERAKPEMTATVTFQEPRREQTGDAASDATITTIPKSAISRIDGDARAWVVIDGKAVARTLTLGPERLDVIEVRSGVAPGEAVVLSPPAALKDGGPVRVKGAN